MTTQSELLSKAPEGATHYADSANFYKKENGRVYLWLFNRDCWIQCEPDPIHNYLVLLPQPIKENWFGCNKLPPIGSEVTTWYPDAIHKSAIQAHDKNAKIVAHHDDAAIFEYDHEGCRYYHAFYQPYFRPLKSDREKFIDKGVDVIMDKHLNFLDGNDKYLGALYDAGFRIREDK